MAGSVYVFAVVMAMVIVMATSQSPTPATTKVSAPTDAPAPVLTADNIKTVLDVHNEARRSESAKEMPELKWSADLAVKAQNWTDACKFAHQPPRVRRWGENIAAVGNTRPIPSQLTAMINEWIAEKKFNTGGTFEECCSFRASDCCHYTQVVWSRTTHVGCGYTVCPTLAYGSGSLTDIAFLACYYTPSGNSPIVTYDWKPFVPGPALPVPP